MDKLSIDNKINILYRDRQYYKTQLNSIYGTNYVINIPNIYNNIKNIDKRIKELSDLKNRINKINIIKYKINK